MTEKQLNIQKLCNVKTQLKTLPERYESFVSQMLSKIDTAIEEERNQ